LPAIPFAVTAAALPDFLFVSVIGKIREEL
jgi:hypothetical protein